MTLLARALPGILSQQGSSFAPTDIANLEAWYDASQITGKSDGDAISQWDDLSGNARHLTQATGANQPLYKTGIINGKPVVRFDGVNDVLRADSVAPFLQGTANFTVLAALRYRTETLNVFALSAGRSNSTSQVVALGTSPGSASRTWHRVFQSGSSSTSPESTVPAIYTGTIVLRREGASYSFQVNGETAFTNTHYDANVNQFGLGALIRTSTTNHAAVDIGEVLVYSRALTTGELDQLRTEP